MSKKYVAEVKYFYTNTGRVKQNKDSCPPYGPGEEKKTDDHLLLVAHSVKFFMCAL